MVFNFRCLKLVMVLKNDIYRYAEEMQDSIKVTEVKPLREGKMIVTFSTGEKRLF